MHFAVSISLGVMFACCSAAFGQPLEYPEDAPRPTPLTRPVLKQSLEDVKIRAPRIPLPELTAEDREHLGDRADHYETRLRYHYLNSGVQPRRGSRPEDPASTLDYGFKVQLFWIVSRVNNCQYCIGHQESKLLGAGLTEDRIAALDCDWSQFTPAEQAAFAFARKFSFQPHRMNDADIALLREHYTDMQIIEMILSMGWNNSINRWKEAVGVPQNPDEGGYSRMTRVENGAAVDVANLPRGTYLTPTSPRYQNRISTVAAVSVDPATGQPTRNTVTNRPPLESQAAVEAMLAECRQRASRLPLLDEAATRERMALDAGQPVPNWMRLLAHFPVDGINRAKGIFEADNDDHLNPLLKAQLSWIVARHDRAWYAVGQARDRLRAQGQTDEQIYALDGDWSDFTPGEQALFRVAQHLAASPVVLTGEEVAQAVELAGPAAVVQAVHYVTQRAAFNRVTEAAGLPLE